MLIADGGGGGSDWAGMSIEMMRALIQNPNVESHYKLLAGWQRSYELVGDHMAQVIGYRDNLMAAWPPKKSAAAAAYRDRLNELIADLKATYEASIANHDAFAAATMSISLAQHDFEQIWQEHEANKAKLAEYQNDVAMSSAATFDTTPPVTSMQQEAVRQKAITLMSSVSSDLAQAQVRIVRPNPYTTSADSGDGTVKNAGSTHTAPPIRPITPTPAGGGASQSSSKRPASARAGGPVSTGVTRPPGSTQQPGLVLGGAPPPAAVPASPGLPSGGTPSSPPGDSSGVNPLPPGGGIRPSTGAPATRARTGEGIVPTRGLRAMPPGGLIGGTPGSGLGEPGAPRPETRRVNPVGGIIGEGEVPARSGLNGVAGVGVVPGGPGAAKPGQGRKTGARGLPTSDRSAAMRGRPGAMDSYGQFGGRRSSRRDQPGSSRWDPDNPWETAEGVDPVVLPPREQRIDPGPAIGLH
jgi:hypothetical protein